VYSLGGGSGEVGIAFATGAASLVCLVLLGGVLADRHGRGRVLLVAETMRMLTQALLAALLLTGTAHYWEVLAAQVSIGAGAALAQPALTGLVAEIVAPQGRQSANALRGMLGSLAMVSGPVLAGAAIALGGPGAAVALDAASYAASALLLLSLGPVIAAREGPARRSTFGVELRAGWVEFSTRTWLWVMVAAFAAVNLFVFGPFEVLDAETAHASLGGAGAWSAILAAFGFGSLLGALLASAWEPGRPLRATACLLLAWVPLLLALAGPAPLAAIAAAATIAGAGWLLLAAIREATMQTRVPAERLSRVASYDWLGSNALLPVGLSLSPAPVGRRSAPRRPCSSRPPSPWRSPAARSRCRVSASSAGRRGTTILTEPGTAPPPTDRYRRASGEHPALRRPPSPGSGRIASRPFAGRSASPDAREKLGRLEGLAAGEGHAVVSRRRHPRGRAANNSLKAVGPRKGPRGFESHPLRYGRRAARLMRGLRRQETAPRGRTDRTWIRPASGHPAVNAGCGARNASPTPSGSSSAWWWSPSSSPR
jgi:MFS family permease